MITGCQNNEVTNLELKIKEQEKTIEELNHRNTEMYKERSIMESKVEELNKIVAESKQNKHPLEIEFEKEMKTWSGNTSEGVEILCTNGDKWKDEMEKYYELLNEELDEDKKKWLESSQEKWEIYIEENEELGWQIFDQQYHGGTIIQILSAELYYNRYHDRALDLIQKYEELTSIY